MNHLVVGVIPSGIHDGLEKHMQVWVIESGMEAELTTVKINGSTDGLTSDLDAQGDKVLGLLVPIKLIPPDQTQALEALAKSRKIAFYRLG
jgi:hypothetical protein